MSKITPLAMPKTTSVVKPVFVAPKATPADFAPDAMPSREQVAASIDTDRKAKVVRPGPKTVLVDGVDDGVRKAKTLVKGQRVRPFLHGEARGGVRVVEANESLEDGAIRRISFSSGHPTQDYKAAYRFLDVDAEGKPTKVRVAAEPSFVPAHDH